MTFPLYTLRSQFTSFFGAAKMIVGNELAALADLLTTAASGLTAHAGGGQTSALPLAAFANQIDTVATGADSVKLPMAVPGTMVFVNNNTATAMQVFGQQSNPANGGAGDTITAQGSHSPIATGTGISVAAGVACFFICMKLGNWKQGSIS